MILTRKCAAANSDRPKYAYKLRQLTPSSLILYLLSQPDFILSHLLQRKLKVCLTLISGKFREADISTKSRIKLEVIHGQRFPQTFSLCLSRMILPYSIRSVLSNSQCNDRVLSRLLRELTVSNVSGSFHTGSSVFLCCIVCCICKATTFLSSHA